MTDIKNYCCKPCNYSTPHKFHYERHLKSKSHFKISNLSTKEKIGQKVIDEGIIIWFPGPNSYTGEDLAELQIHGSNAVINALFSKLNETSPLLSVES